MSGYKIHVISDLARGTSQLYLRLTWTSAFKQFLLFYASPLSLSFTYLTLFLYTQCVVCILYRVRVLYPVCNPWSTVGSTCFILTELQTLRDVEWLSWRLRPRKLRPIIVHCLTSCGKMVGVSFRGLSFRGFGSLVVVFVTTSVSFQGHKHGGRNPTETSVFEFCHKRVNSSLDELIKMKVVFILRQELFRQQNLKRSSNFFTDMGESRALDFSAAI